MCFHSPLLNDGVFNHTLSSSVTRVVGVDRAEVVEGGMRRAQSQTRASSLLIKPWTFTIYSRYENLISSHFIVPLNPFATICRYDIPPTAHRLRTTCLIGAQSSLKTLKRAFSFQRLDSRLSNECPLNHLINWRHTG